MARLRDKDDDVRAPSIGDGYIRRVPDTKKSFRKWLSEPGAKPALALFGLFFFIVWSACMFTGVVLSAFLGITSSLGTFVVGNLNFLILLIGWATLGGSRKVLMTEGGALDRVFGFFKKTDPPLEFDEGPALLARKRGNAAEAQRLYRAALRELPHRLEFMYRIAEIDQVDLKRVDEAMRGYRRFLNALDAAEREPTEPETECATLARIRLEDLSRAAQEPKRRRIEI